MAIDVQKAIPIPEPTDEPDALWTSVKALKECVETMQGIRGNREYALDQVLDQAVADLEIRIDNLVVAAGAGATELSELSDVTSSTPTNRNALMADGADFTSRAIVEADISDLSHSVGVTGLGIWKYRTETAAPPASGQIRFNNADVSLATTFYLHETNDEGVDVSTFLELMLQDGSVLYMQDQTNAANHYLIEISTSVDSGTYRTYGIQAVSEAGVEPGQNTNVILVTSGIAAAGTGVTQLSDLSDVNTSTPTDRNILIADSVDFESRPLVAADLTTPWEFPDPDTNIQPAGYNTMPIYEIDANDVFDTAHQGMLWHKDAGAAVTFTCDNVAGIDQGAAWVVHNDDTEDLTIAEGAGVTIEFLLAGGLPVTGNVTLEQGAIVTVYKYTDTVYWCWGSKEILSIVQSLIDLSDVTDSTKTNRNILIADGADFVSRALTAADTASGTFVDGRIAQSNVTQHEAALTILETQITNGSLLARVGSTETITGVWTLDAPIGTADYGTGGRVKDGLDNTKPIGFNLMPVYDINIADTFDLAHNGMFWHKSSGGAISFTCNNDGNIPIGATYVVFNDDTEDLTIAAGTATVYFIQAGAAKVSGSVAVENGGIVTVFKHSDTDFYVWGNKDPGASAPVSSVFGRTSAVVALTGDYSAFYSLLAHTHTGSTISALDAGDTTTGTFADARIPSLDASKTTTGAFADARIPNLNASKTTAGAFADARIPNLNASKITAGTLVVGRGGTGTTTSTGTGSTVRSASPTFTGTVQVVAMYATSGINIGHASDSTVTRASAAKLEVEGRPIFAHNDAALASGRVHVSTSAPSGGTDGDIWLEREA